MEKNVSSSPSARLLSMANICLALDTGATLLQNSILTMILHAFSRSIRKNSPTNRSLCALHMETSHMPPVTGPAGQLDESLATPKPRRRASLGRPMGPQGTDFRAPHSAPPTKKSLNLRCERCGSFSKFGGAPLPLPRASGRGRRAPTTVDSNPQATSLEYCG